MKWAKQKSRFPEGEPDPDATFSIGDLEVARGEVVRKYRPSTRKIRKLQPGRARTNSTNETHRILSGGRPTQLPFQPPAMLPTITSSDRTIRRRDRDR